MSRSSLVVLALSFLLFACNRDRAGETPLDATHDHGTAAAGTNAAATDTATAPPAAPMITFPSVSGNASGYLAPGQSSAQPGGRKPALIVIQEWWGVDEYIRQQTDRYAQQGYVALAVDLYRGRVTSDQGEAHELSRGLPEDRAIADLKAGFEYLASRADVDPARIGVIGWCLGGGYALKLATHEPRLAATVINYGSLVTDHAAVARITGPVLGNFGAEDRGIPVADVKQFEQTLTAAGKLGDIKIYDGAGHAFMNPNNKEGYNAAAAQDAQARIDRFFDRTLRANIPNS